MDDIIIVIRQVIDLAGKIMPPETAKPLQDIEAALLIVAKSKESDLWKKVSDEFFEHAEHTPFERDVGIYSLVGSIFRGYSIDVARREKAQGN